MRTKQEILDEMKMMHNEYTLNLISVELLMDIRELLQKEEST